MNIKRFYTVSMCLVICLAASCSSSSTNLSPNAMKQLALKVAQSRYDKAMLLDIQSNNTHVPPLVIVNPFKHHQCWYALLSDPAKAITHPDREYVCVSDQGVVIFPLKVDDFPLLMEGETFNTQSCPALIDAAKYFIHLSQLALQDGWMILNNAEDYQKITFNVVPDPPTTPELNKSEKQFMSAISPPRCDMNEQKASVMLWTWSVIGGTITQWTVDLLPVLKLQSDARGRRGGGGYD